MEVKTLAEVIKIQQENILGLKLVLDSLIEELVDEKLIDYKKLESRVNKKLKRIQKLSDKVNEENDFGFPFTQFNGPIGEA